MFRGNLWLHFNDKKGAAEISVNMSNVEYVEAVGDHARLHFVSGKSLTILDPLNEVNECLANEAREQNAQGT